MTAKKVGIVTFLVLLLFLGACEGQNGDKPANDVLSTGDVADKPVNDPLPVGDVAVPGVTEKIDVFAETKIIEAGLTVGSVTYEKYSGIPSGIVADQVPPEGTLVYSGDSVNLVVADDPQNPRICEDYEMIRINEFILYNNVWGKKNITEYRQCIFGSGAGSRSGFGWAWRWPHGDGRVKGYPAVVYGQTPWKETSTTTRLPLQIGELRDIAIEFEVETVAEGIYNLAFDIWITNTNTPKMENIENELMIWLVNTAIPVPGFVETVILEDKEYDFFQYKKLLAFVKKNPMLKGRVGIKVFLDYLENGGYLDSGHYVSSIEFGNEMVQGAGQTRVYRYSVEVDR